MDIVYQKNAEILVFLWASGHVKNGKLFQNVIKVNIFAFLSLGGVFLGVKNNSKNFGNKKKYKVA